LLTASREWIRIAEVNPPELPDMRHHRLTPHWSHVLITDNVFGKIRVSPFAFAARITHDTPEVHPTVVVSTRDRNILAIESEVRGALGNGVDSFLVVIGDTVPHIDHMAHHYEIVEHLRQLQSSLPDFEVGMPTRFREWQFRRRIEVADKQLSQLTLQERDLAKDLEFLVESIAERHRVDLPRVIGDYHFRELPDAQVRERIDELLRLVERMGEINLTAIEEYEEKSQRYEYLTGQRADLETALSQLDKAIRQMNKESKRMFRETFDDVNARFKQVFPRLFGGGKAELQLTDPDDLLETGVEIVAQPPGKKLGSIELMSGGEKALTAVSLIFSIFQHRPSPFCLLDEVDAPLDEANIGRFAEAIRAMTKHSQFIVITHSKTTMQTADVLYGVTMETPGISKLVAVELRKNQAKRDDADRDSVAVA